MFEVVKEHYFESISLREKIESRASLRAGLTVALGSGIVFLVKSYEFAGFCSFADIVMLVGLIVASGGVIWSAGWLGAMLAHPVKYDYVPSQERMLEYRDELQELNPKKVENREKAGQITREDFEINYAEAADHNFTLNKAKSKRVYKSGYGIVVAVGAILVAAGPFVYLNVADSVSSLPTNRSGTMSDSTEEVNSLRKPDHPRNRRISQDAEADSAEKIEVSKSSKNNES